MVASVHATLTIQAFNGLEHGMVGASFILCAYPRGGGAGLKTCDSIRGEDAYTT